MPYSEQTKQKIIDMKEAGASWKMIGLALGKKNGNAVKAWWDKNHVNLLFPPRVKVSKKITDGRKGLEIKRTGTSIPRTSIADIRRKLVRSRSPGTPCPSQTTIYGSLMDDEYTMIRLLNAPLINYRSYEKILDFLKENTESVENISTFLTEKPPTIWSDEIIVRKCPNQLDLHYRCHSNTENIPVDSQVQQGGFSVMFWGCFTAYGLGPLVALEGNQNHKAYKHTLETFLLPEIEATKILFGIDMIFMQDNAPCHKTNFIKDFLASKNVSVLDWPPQSSDINPIENLWAIIKERRYKKFGIPCTKDDLIDQIFKIWNEINRELHQASSNNTQKKFREVITLMKSQT